MIADRHTDTEAFPFSTAEAAIQFAKDSAEENARTEDDIEEEEVEGFIYHARYSCEGDSVWVVEREMDDPDGSS